MVRVIVMLCFCGLFLLLSNNINIFLSGIVFSSIQEKSASLAAKQIVYGDSLLLLAAAEEQEEEDWEFMFI